MAVYLEEQRKKVVALIKTQSPLFEGAEAGKVFLRKERDFVLKSSEKNFHPLLRGKVAEYFRKNRISWWGGSTPTGHTLSSQVACLNHLFAIREDKIAALVILQNIDSDFIEPLLIETDSYAPGYIQFEAISDRDHLNEGTSIRGSQCTSIDALMYARHRDGSKWIIPIEWKYTESYDNLNKAREGATKDAENCKGTVRQKRYNQLIANSQQLSPKEDITNLYYEPFYQLMRQTLWAEQMVNHNATERIKADNFLHVHVIPAANHDLLSKHYPPTKTGMEQTWRTYLKNQGKYQIIEPQNLMKGLQNNKNYCALMGYLEQRYWG